MRALAALLAATIALLAPAAAHAAASVQIFDETLFVAYDNSPKAFGALFPNPNGNKDYVVDEDQPITPTAPCTVFGAPANHDVVCPGAGLFKLFLSFGEGDDQFGLQAGVLLDVHAEGGKGDDAIFAAGGDDLLIGNKGGDQLDGGGANDVLTDGDPASISGAGAGGDDSFFGGAGNDYLDGGRLSSNADSGSGGDVLDGEGGVNTVDYSRRVAPLRITEGDGQANDGQAGEHDAVANTAIVFGGAAADLITGAGEGNTLHGGPAGDGLAGGEGPDLLLGEAGNDVLVGGPANDVIQGGNGIDTASYGERAEAVRATLDGAANDGARGGAEGDRIDDGTENLTGGAAGDTLVGNSGANVLRGNGGVDVLRAVGGDDTIDARDGGSDQIRCGTGVDGVLGDAADIVPPDCESARVGARRLGRLQAGGQVTYAGGRISASIGCPKGAVGGCTSGRLALIGGGKQLGAAGFAIAAGKTAAIKVPVSAAALGNRKDVTVVAVARSAIGVSRMAKVKR